MSDVQHDFLQGGGDMGALMRSLDWSRTPIGPAASWPQSLRTAVSICLNSRFPIVLWWGPELVMLYNDAYRGLVGDKHPRAMGQRAAECWAEVWDIIGPMLRGVLHDGVATWSEDQMLPLKRRGFVEECFFTFTYSPMRDESGGIGGVFCAVVETTERVIEERRLRLLKALSDDAAHAKSAREAFERLATTLGSARDDLTFALLYAVEDDARTRHATLVGTVGMAWDSPASPSTLALDAAAPWPLGRALETRTRVLVQREEVSLGAARSEGWPEQTRVAALLPLSRAGHDRPYGFAIVGLSPRHALDASCERFVDLLGSHLAQAVANASAREEEQKRVAALAALDRAKTDFFSNVSHEFRTPLTLALGPIEDALDSPERALFGEALEAVHRNQLRLLKLVNTLLDFSRFEAGRIDASYEPADLARLTADLASAFRSAMERGGLCFEVSCPELPEPVYVDRDMWEKIVLNLLSNAFKFTLAGSVRVRLTARDERAELEVSDTGAGIPSHELERVFDRFHRIEGVPARTHEGTGIGLALVRDLVALHGGEIGVRSELGEGSTFTVSLPFGCAHLPAERVRAQKTQASTALRAQSYVTESLRWLPHAPSDGASVLVASAGSERNASEPANILVADDNADMRDYVARLLASRWSVHTVPDGQAALDVIARARPDLVLADVMMPRVNGFELAQRLRAHPETRTIPIVLLSARAGEEATQEGLRAGADDYLIKPFSANVLVARIEAQLSLARLRDEAHRQIEAERTAAEEARRAAESANRLKDEFLATVSHELRTPLNAIVGWAAMLQAQRDVMPARAQKGLDVIERNARAQAQIIDDLLDISRIVTGKLSIDARPIDLTLAVQDAFDAIRHAAAAKQVEVSLDVTDPPYIVEGDAGRLRQVAWNLLSNAVRHTQAGGRVHARLSRVAHDVELSVRDTGMGIRPEFLPHVWERFRQFDSSASRAHGGLGLGLAIVKSVVVDLHGGQVAVASDGIGQGATFSVRVPVVQNGARVVPARVAANEREGATPLLRERLLDGRRVLVVEDDDDSRELMSTALVQLGASVSVASSAQQALERIDGEEPELLITDIGMPERDGYWLLEQIRRTRGPERLPAIALTAYARASDVERARRAGFAEHVKKPVDVGMLARLAVELLDGARSREP